MTDYLLAIAEHLDREPHDAAADDPAPPECCGGAGGEER